MVVRRGAVRLHPNRRIRLLDAWVTPLQQLTAEMQGMQRFPSISLCVRCASVVK